MMVKDVSTVTSSVSSALRPAVFLDRDGTINEQMGYINHISRFQMLPGVAAAIRRLNEARIPVVVVTNQSGLARGYFPAELLTAVHEKMVALLAKDGAHVDGIYVCPHHPEAKKEEYRLNCNCRKPKPGLLLLAAAEMGLDLARSVVVGDRWSDLKTAKAVGALPVLVLTGYGRGDAQYIGPTQEVQPAFVGVDLAEAVQWILGTMKI
jgi:D-glycero-D-manno-heptose 1,7-bisphosphate phosphatase